MTPFCSVFQRLEVPRHQIRPKRLRQYQDAGKASQEEARRYQLALDE